MSAPIADPAPVDGAPGRPPGRAPSRGRGRGRLWLAGALIVGALGFLVVQGLGNATLYFRTVDEAVAQREALGERRFRIQGDVVAGSVDRLGNDVSFTLVGTDAEVEVLHHGDPPELFQPGIPVVLEGRFEGDRFASDRILVKHSETYVAENPDRVEGTVPDGGGAGATDPASPGGGRQP